MNGNRWVGFGCAVILLLLTVGCGQAAVTTTTSSSILSTTTTTVSAEEVFVRDILSDIATFTNLFKDNGTATDLTVWDQYEIIHQLWTKWHAKTGVCEKSNELVALWQKTLRVFDTGWRAYAMGNKEGGDAAFADSEDADIVGAQVGELLMEIATPLGIDVEREMAIYETTTTTAKLVATTTTDAESAYKASCQDLDFRQLKKNPDGRVGERLYYKGEVVQIQESGDVSVIRLAVDKDLDNILLVFFPQTLPEVFDKSIIEVWGECDGSHTYESQAGWQITVPLLVGRYLTYQ